MNKSELIQQGDVLIYTNATIPQGAEEVQPKNNRLVLAEGETTGHAHVADLATFPGVKMFKFGNDLFLRTPNTIEIVHEEHHKVKVPAGDHCIKLVQEVDPFSEEIRSVKD